MGREGGFNPGTAGLGSRNLFHSVLSSCGCFSVLEPGAVAFPLISAAMRVPTPPLVLSVAA